MEDQKAAFREIVESLEHTEPAASMSEFFNIGVIMV